MNRELLARVRDRIAEVGTEHCDMGLWSQGTPRADGESDCETTACIAGWTMAILNGSFDIYTYNGDVLHEAGAALGLTDRAAGRLFLSGWPCHYEDLAFDEGDAKGMMSLLDAILDGRVIFDNDGNLVDLEAHLVEEVEEMTR